MQEKFSQAIFTIPQELPTLPAPRKDTLSTTPGLSVPAGPVPRAAALAKADFFTQCQQYQQIITAEMSISTGVTYGVAIDLHKNSLYCTCPFYPKPCIHAQALFLLQQNAGTALFTLTDTLPDWAPALLAGRATLLRPDQTAQQEVAREQRRFERLERAANGFEDLEVWLLDTFRRGVATVASEDPRWYEGIATRMADASMTGISRTLRLLGQIPATQTDWAEQVLAVLAECYLAVRAFRRRAALPEALGYDLQTYIGVALKKEEVVQSGERVTDVWAVVGQAEETLEEKLRSRRTWLLGPQSGRYALLLDFAFGGMGFPQTITPGSIRQGTLAYYPSAWPQRALTVTDLTEVPKKVEKLPGLTDFSQLLAAFAAALGQQPWLAVFPAALSDCTPYLQGNQFFMADKMGKSLPLQTREDTFWRLLSVSGGHPVSLFGVWDGAAFQPLSVVSDQRFIRLS